MKLRFFNKRLRNNYLKIASILLTVESFILIFIDLSSNIKLPVLFVSLLIYAFLYIAMYLQARTIVKREIDLGNTKITVKFGDLFDEEGLKVISCNEFFDSQVDGALISSKTLHGKVMTEYITDISDFDQKLISDDSCNNRIIERDVIRAIGKHNRYQLGTCFRYNGFIFVAFTKFDDDNKAYLDLPSYMFGLSNMWDEINRVYGGNNIVVPFVGSRMTRITGSSNINKQEQLEMLVNSLKYSGISFAHDCKITIVLPDNLKNELSIYEL